MLMRKNDARRPSCSVLSVVSGQEGWGVGGRDGGTLLPLMELSGALCLSPGREGQRGRDEKTVSSDGRARSSGCEVPRWRSRCSYWLGSHYQCSSPPLTVDVDDDGEEGYQRVSSQCRTSLSMRLSSPDWKSSFRLFSTLIMSSSCEEPWPSSSPLPEPASSEFGS